MSARFAEDAQRLLESLERRSADQQLVDLLAAGNFTGPHYDRFANELAGYALAVLRGWMHSGYIFTLTAGRGFALNPTDGELDELTRDSDLRDELSIMTVAKALPRFQKQALEERGWRMEGGASLSTYFMGACVYVFPNEFRARRAQRVRWHRQDRGDPAVTAPREDKVSDPASIVVGRQRVRDDLDRCDPRAQAIIALTIDGYTQAEIEEMLAETSVRAIEGVLHRWRTKEKRRLQGGGPDE
ncbi:hypothetical protein [Asanoa siamensis]|nr:hypothetical protein [Asanoa siamensis]